jgi:sugar lactone lactonase YvrE
VLEATGSGVYRTIREGTATSAPDPEFRVYNRGSGSATFTVAFDTSVTWLVPNRTAGTAFAAPPGSSSPDPVVVQMTVSAASVPKGFHDGVISLVGPNDVWNGVDGFQAFLYVYDGRLTVIDSTLYTQVSSLALAPDGALAIASNGTIYRMNPTTGAYAPWATGVGQFIGSMAFGPDSALYVADRVTNRVLRVSPAGVVSTLFATAEAPLDVEVLPDGTVFATAGRLILRRSPQGVLTTLLTRPSRGGTLISLAYMDGWLYYMDYGELGRVNPFTGADERRGTVSISLNPDLEAGQSGRLYANAVEGGLIVLDDTGHEVDRVYTPWTPSFALGDGVLYGTGSPYQTWKLPLADKPATAAVLVGDPSGDGQVTSLDALGVLSYVVGKPLPAGWNMRLGGDADCDGEVTAVDALVILSKIVGKDVAAFCVGSRR